MTIAKKFLVPFLFVLFIVLSGIVVVGFSTSDSIANADATTYYSKEQYTNSDYLLLDNGKESLTKTIKDFSDGVKSASAGTSFPELAQVIPRQYLETSTTNDEFYYNGKEYGCLCNQHNVR